MAKIKKLWIPLVCIFTAILCILWRDSPLILQFEQRFYDLRVRFLSASEQTSENIIIIGIDDESLSRLQPAVGRWPWPRAVFAGLVDFCSQADTIAFDILFSEADNYYASSDDLFADEVKKQEKVILALFLSNQPLTNPIPSKVEDFSLNTSFSGNSPIVEFHSALIPYPSLLEASYGLGHVNYVIENDGVLRSHILASKLSSKIYPSLALAVAMKYYNISPKELKIDKKGILNINNQTVGIDPDGKFRFVPTSDKHKIYSIADILTAWQDEAKGKIPKIKRKEFENKLVLVGSLATGLIADRHITTGVGNMPGVCTTAIALDNLLNGKFIRILPDIGEIILIAILCFLPIAPTLKRPRVMIIVVFSVFLVYLVAVILCLFNLKLMLPMTAPYLGLFSSSIALSLGYWYSEILHRQKLEVNLKDAYENLRLTNKRLEDYSHSLEAEVEKRTGELKKNNVELENEITERKRIEQTLVKQAEELAIANAKLISISRHKDQFLANMSHELRTPLNAVLGAAELLSEGIQGALNEKQLKSIKMISDSGQHLLALINDILDLAKIEEGKIELNICSISVMSACLSSLQFIKQLAHKKGIEVLFECPSENNKTLRTDERRLKQILVNLLSNAVKFTPEKGRVGLDVVDDAELRHTKFIVWDTGIGIPDEDRERLFKPFVQLDSSLKREHEGTGLGLSLVDRLTKMLGGTIFFESKIGQGSRFIISLPWNDEMDHSSDRIDRDDAGKIVDFSIPNRNSTQSEKSNINILLAEDNEATSETVSEYLQFHGYKVTVAKDGITAIDQAMELAPNLILMDIQMPNMDGLEAIRRLRSNEKFSTIPIIALTALAMPEDLKNCMTAGADSYISKPVKLQGLLEQIENQLKR